MRNTVGIAFLFTATLGACSWSSFDDLGGETWVDSVGGAEGVSPHDFLGLAAPGMTGGNSVFVALGRAGDSVGAYTYDKDGIRSTEGVDISQSTLQIAPFPPEAPIAGDPYSNRIGFAAVTGDGATGDTKCGSFNADDLGTDVVDNDFNNGAALDGNIQPTGMAFARTDDDSADLTTTDIVLARGPQIAMVTNYASTNLHRLAGCYGTDVNGIVLSVARGEFEGDADDDEVVAAINDITGAAPQLVIFNGRAVTTTFNLNINALDGCFDDADPSGNRVPIARIAGHSADPDFGHHMVVGDFDGDGHDDIAVSSPTENTVAVYMNNGNTPPTFTEVAVGPLPAAEAFGGSLAAGDLDGVDGDELVVGAPQASFEGADHGGLAAVFKFAAGEFTKAFEVHDIQPEPEQAMGTSVAVVPWTTGGHNVLVVGGDHEIFTYFQTQLYGDVRQQ